MQKIKYDLAGTKRLWVSVFMSAIFPMALGFVLAESFSDWRWSHYPFHSVIESIGAVSALIIATLMVIMIKNDHLSQRYIMVACALIGMGLLDGFHAVLYAGAPYVWLHSVATMVGGIMFAMVWFSGTWLTEKGQQLLLLTVVTVSLLTGIVSIVQPDILPVMVIDGEFSLSAKVINFTGGIGFLIGTAYFIHDYLLAKKTRFVERKQTEDIVFANHCLLFGIAGLLFETSVLWDAGWWWWHVLRLLAYLIVLIYFFILFEQGQHQLRISEERHRLINSRIPGVLYQFKIDVNGNRSLPYVSPTVEEYLGLSSETVMGDVEKWFALTHPNDLPGLESSIIESMENMTLWEWEGRFIRNGNDVRWLSGSSSPMKLQDGSVIWDGVFVDITERKQEEAKTKFSQEQVQLLLDSTGEAIYGVDLNGDCTFANPACAHTVGYESVNELLGKNMHELMHHTRTDGSHYPVEDCRIYQAHITGEHTHVTDEVFWKKDGSSFPVEYQAYPIKRDDENIGSVVAFIDITERKQAEQELIRSEERLNDAQRLAKMGGWELNLLDNNLFWSNEIFNIFEIDISKFDASYETFLNAIHPEDRDRVNKAYTDSLLNHEPYEIVHRLQMNDGRIKYVRETCESFFDGDKPVRSVGTVQDITDVIIVEKELAKYREHLEELVDERTKELQDAQSELVRKERLATLGQLTATVSHELRNPLGAMRPSLYILNKYNAGNDERINKALDVVDRNVDRCDRIIDELLDFTRITDLDKHATRIDEWLESVIADQVIHKDIQVEKDFSLNDVELVIDSNILRRAVINVVENACHAMMDDKQQLKDKKNAHLHIKTRAIDECIEIIITDTGSGIADDARERIFEPLFSTKGFGVGLGMSIVKQIMEQHGGGVEVNSEEGKGTTVSLWLPMTVAVETFNEVMV